MTASLNPLTMADLALALTRQQAEAAVAADWSRLDDLLDQRAPLTAALAALDPASLDPATRAELRVRLEATVVLDRRITARAQAAHSQFRHDLGHLHHTRRTLTAYATPAGADEARFIDRAR